MGNRFKGGIVPGAMPLLHRYLGNPVLSWIGRLFFYLKVGDFHCGLRGFNRLLGLFGPLTLAETNAWAAPVLVDEFDDALFERL